MSVFTRTHTALRTFMREKQPNYLRAGVGQFAAPPSAAHESWCHHLWLPSLHPLTPPGGTRSLEKVRYCVFFSYVSEILYFKIYF